VFKIISGCLRNKQLFVAVLNSCLVVFLSLNSLFFRSKQLFVEIRNFGEKRGIFVERNKRFLKVFLQDILCFGFLLVRNQFIY